MIIQMAYVFCLLFSFLLLLGNRYLLNGVESSLSLDSIVPSDFLRMCWSDNETLRRKHFCDVSEVVSKPRTAVESTWPRKKA